jgi:hypothetical protein
MPGSQESSPFKKAELERIFSNNKDNLTTGIPEEFFIE